MRGSKMRLKIQVEEEIRNIGKARRVAKENNDIEALATLNGMYQALNWVLDTRSRSYNSISENYKIPPKSP